MIDFDRLIHDHAEACGKMARTYATVSVDAEKADALIKDVLTTEEALKKAILTAVTAEQSECKAPIITAHANLIKYVCHSAARDAGWWRVPTFEPSGLKVDVRKYPPHILQWWIGTKIALMHSELSEALEGERKDKMDDHLPHLKSRDVEFADAIIRIMDLCGGLGIDIGRAITEKLAYNAQRADHKIENREAAGGKAF